MIRTEIHTNQISGIYSRFAKVIGDTHWEKLVKKLNSEIKGNKFLSDYIKSENSITYQLESMRKLSTEFGCIPLNQIEISDIYPAIAFAEQALSIMDQSSQVLAKQFKRRIHGAIKNPDDMRGLRLELSAATHFARRGLKFSWPEMDGVGTYDLLIEELGPNGLEVECKSFSCDKGRKIHRREVLDFYNLLWPLIKKLNKTLNIGLSVVLTIPNRFPSKYKDRLYLAKQVSKYIHEVKSTSLEGGATLKITEFDPSHLNVFQDPPSSKAIRSVVDEVTNTENRDAMALETSAGGALLLTVKSAQDDTFLKTIFDTLNSSAKRQLTGTRGSIFFTGLHGLRGEQLLSIALEEKHSSQTPTALRLGVSNFLSETTQEHIVGIAFISNIELLSKQNGHIDSGGSAYYFPKKESTYWSNDFSGLFSS